MGTDMKSGCVLQTAPVTMEASRVDEPQPEAEPDEEVSAQRDRVEVTRALKQAAAQSDLGNFTEAQHVLDVADTRIKAKRVKTKMSEAMCSEIADARNRTQNRSAW